MTTPPNTWRRLLAEIWADAEDHGLGTWTPHFQPNPNKIEQACAFVETRSALLTEKRLYPTTELPDLAEADDEELLALYHAVHAATAELLLPGVSVSHEQIGLAAWNRLNVDQRRNSLGTLLESYTCRILDEERERQADGAVDALDKRESCLEPHDIASAWDSVVDHSSAPAAEDETIVDRDVLQRLLDEIHMLRRRLAEPVQP